MVYIQYTILTTIEHFIMRPNPSFKYTNYVEIFPKKFLIFQEKSEKNA